MMNKDVHFVNSLYGQANETPSKKLDAVFLSIILFFVISLIWASFSQIDELVRGQGTVIPANRIQTIQNLDGGIISEILVKEGHHVQKDQALMKIDTVRYEASLEENKEAYFSLLAKRTRLNAELTLTTSQSIPKLNFPKELTNSHSNFIKVESDLFFNKVNEYKNSINTLEFQLSQKRQELQEILAKEKQLERSLVFIAEQRDTIKKMVQNGSKSNIELLKAESSYNETKGNLEATTLSIPRSKLAIEEAESKIYEKISNFKTESSTKMQETESELKKFTSRLVSDKDKLSKTIVRSPVNGIIKIINLNTIGGVVRSGDNLLEIVPDNDILLIEAKIDPKDIAFINPTLNVIVKITAYDFSIYGALEGKIVEISADSMKDKDSKDNKMYYKVLVQTTQNYLERNGIKYSIIPGMVASVDIVTGKKTIMDFIL
ncbi:MAG: HlyD family type I secretion periplasmic adaptor subunit, partial [Arcobacter sp.]|nr:HlyD family type I secretion periplasmic adaptor subunit [Arcobacter sp.]